MGDLGTVVDDIDAHSLGQCRIHQGHLRLEPLDHFGGIGPGALKHHPEDPLLPIYTDSTETRCLPLLYKRDILDGDRLGIFGAYDGVADVIEALVESRTADEVLLPVELKVLSTYGAVALFQRCDDLAVGDIDALEPLGVDVYLILLFIPAPADDLFDTVHRLEKRGDSVLLKLSELTGGVGAALIPERIPEHLPQTGGVGSHDRGSPPFGDIDGVQTFGDQLTQQIGVVAVFEEDGDIAQPEDGVGEDHLHSGQTRHRRFDGVGDELFDILCGVPGTFGIDHHLLGGDIREGIHGDLFVGFVSKSGDGDKECQNEEFVLYEQLKESFHMLLLMPVFTE